MDKLIDFNPIAHDPTFYGEAFGWECSPAKVDEALERIEKETGAYPLASVVATAILEGADDGAPIFFWEGEEKALGKRLGTWNQKSVGSCVGFGSTRAGQDLLFWEIAAGESEQYPGTELCPEATYGGSRVEVGGGQIRGDGSLGVWAAEFIRKWGIIQRGKYGQLDLTTYNESTCRALGAQGLPTDLETLAREHPVTSTALVEDGNEAWALVGAGKPISVCSNRGFTMERNQDGTCSPSGQWNHCMSVRGRYITPNGKRRVVIGNSWGDYLGDTNNVIEFRRGGQTERLALPAGCFGCELEILHSMLAQGDSFAYAGFSGWKSTRIDYNPLK